MWPTMGTLLLFAAFAQDAAGPQPRLRVTTGEGDAIEARSVEWKGGNVVRVTSSDDATREIAADQIAHIDVIPARPSAAPAGPWQMWTRGGTRLSGDISGGNENALLFVHAQLGELRVPIERLDVVHRRGRAPDPAAGPRPEQDEIRLANGDVDRGLVASLSEMNITLLSGADERKVPWRVVGSVRFTSPPATPNASSPATLNLADGDRIAAEAFRLGDGVVAAETADASAVRFPLAALARVELPGGRRVWLSEFPVEKVETTPFFTTAWPPVMNQSIAGGPLRVDGQTYEKGLGLHSACRLVWTLEGGFSRLTGRIAIDDSGGPWSDADVTVRVDGAPVAHFPGLRHREPPRELNVDLAGAKQLVIEVGFGRNGDVQDRVSLVNAQLQR